jgi:hypothetical protein
LTIRTRNQKSERKEAPPKRKSVRKKFDNDSSDKEPVGEITEDELSINRSRTGNRYHGTCRVRYCNTKDDRTNKSLTWRRIPPRTYSTSTHEVGLKSKAKSQIRQVMKKSFQKHFFVGWDVKKTDEEIFGSVAIIVLKK